METVLKSMRKARAVLEATRTKLETGWKVATPVVKTWVTHRGRLLQDGQKALEVFRHGGLKALKKRLLKKRFNYSRWVSLYDTLSDSDRQAIRARIEKLELQPRFSVVMPTYNSDIGLLREAIESVRGQLYPHWELCIADDCSKVPEVRQCLAEYAARDSRIRVVFREKNGHIAAASNSALELARGDYVALLDHDDVLPEHALYRVAEEVNAHPDADLIYSDEDKLDESGARVDPYFKCEWNPDLFLSQNMISHLGVYRTSLVRQVGGFRTGMDGSQDYDLALRVTERSEARNIRHIPEVLYHWRIVPGSVALNSGQKSYAHTAARKALEEHLERTGVRASVEESVNQLHRVRYDLPSELPLASLIVGTRDRVELLRPLMEGLLHKTDYPRLEILVLDNRSTDPATLEYLASLEVGAGSGSEENKAERRVKVLRYDHPFNFSAMNNWGVSQSSGEIVGLLNNDLQVISPDWLKEMVSHALRPEVGCVGARLYYPNDTIQHAGVFLGILGLAGHSHRGYLRSEPGYMGRAAVTQSLSAVTAACVLLRRKVYDQVGGLDEQRFAVAFNDVDFCLRVREAGYRNIYTPYAELYHFESATRGSDASPENRPRFEREAQALRERWGTLLDTDPAYSPNLTVETEDLAFAFPPRVRKRWWA